MRRMRTVTEWDMCTEVLRRIWVSMRARCESTDSESWENYGKRGIRVCERWQTLENFVFDMGPRPEGKSIDRKDNDRGYEPSNCRWATDTEQRTNKRERRYGPSDTESINPDPGSVFIVVRAARIAADKTQSELGAELGVPWHAINDAERTGRIPKRLRGKVAAWALATGADVSGFDLGPPAMPDPCEVAAIFMRQNGIRFVCRDHDKVLREIAVASGVTAAKPAASVLAQLTNRPGELVAGKGWVISRRTYNRRLLRMFWLPEHVPADFKNKSGALSDLRFTT